MPHILPGCLLSAAAFPVALPPALREQPGPPADSAPQVYPVPHSTGTFPALPCQLLCASCVLLDQPHPDFNMNSATVHSTAVRNHTKVGVLATAAVVPLVSPEAHTPLAVHAPPPLSPPAVPSLRSAPPDIHSTRLHGPADPSC